MKNPLPSTPPPDRSVQQGTEEDLQLQGILNQLLTAKGFDAAQYKRNYIKRRIAVRMRATGADTYEQYGLILKHQKEEAGHLLDRLTIHVTGFFRDAAVFQPFGKGLFHGRRVTLFFEFGPPAAVPEKRPIRPPSP